MQDSENATMNMMQQTAGQVSVFLDTQTRYVEETLERLDALRASVIRRDTGALEEMFEQIQQESERKSQYDRAMKALRQSLASVLKLPAQEVCLSRFFERLEQADRKAFSQRQASLQSLIGRLNNEISATEALLHECARFNRLLLNSIFGNTQQAVTYDARGVSRSNPQGGLMNVRL